MLLRRAIPVLLVTLCACEEVQAPPTEQVESESVEVRDAARGPRFIVLLAEGAVPEAVARAHGVEPAHVYRGVANGFAGRMSDLARGGLLRDARVQRIERDAEIEADSVQPAATWGLDRVDQRVLPLNSQYSFDASGAGVTVYVVDSGIRYSHSEFGGRARFGYDAFGGDGADCYGHGTHVAGTAAGARYGVARGADVVSVKVLGCDGSGSVSAVIAGLDWIVRNGRRPGVANVSIRAATSKSLDDAISRLHQAGIATAVSAGNSGADACDQSPARAPEAMTTAATTSSDARASYSNYGRCVDWFAPGSGITSASHGSDTGTRSMSGTSMAAPHTAGAAALYLQRHPSASAQQVRDGLFSQTSKNRVTQANSENAHLLYTLSDQDGAPVTEPNQPPAASFTASCVDLECSFTNASVDPEGRLASARWAFGDGTSSSELHPKHAFGAAGSFQVQLTVTDDLGQSSSATRTVEVREPAPISLMAARTKARGVAYVVLSWSGARSGSVDIFRDGARLDTVAATGPFTDTLGKGAVPNPVYRVCEAGSSVCSHPVQATF